MMDLAKRVILQGFCDATFERNEYIINRLSNMQVVIYIFWICLGIIFYSYVGYGILLLLLTGIRQLFGNSELGKRLSGEGKEFLPEVTLVVAAYNEEDIINEKIANCLALNYPSDKLSFLFITDGSDDGTTDIVARYPRIRLLHKPLRKGKAAALNRAMMHVHTPVAVFCDANTMLNRSAIRRLVWHYQDSRTGGVSGEKKVLSGDGLGAAAAGEGLYWKYESLLKQLDTELYTVTGAAGELFSIRTSLWNPLPEDVILDDFIISSRINLKGYRVAYEPAAYASELPSASIGEERKRKIRIAAGAFQAMVMLKPMFNAFKHPLLFFQFFSHRFLRWTLAPLSFPLLLLSNMVLVIQGMGIPFTLVLVGQAVFYLLALVGASVADRVVGLRVLKIAFYILFMNYSMYLGFARFLRGRQSVVWEKAGRKVVAASA
jgi:cellulose synthase/poly-beta-1,6-N-acetylglucosamine synthase-like glycosyltransferase